MALARGSSGLLALDRGSGSGLLLLEVGVCAKAALVGGRGGKFAPLEVWQRCPDLFAFTSAISDRKRTCERCRSLAAGRS